MKTKFKTIQFHYLHVGELYSFLLIVHESLKEASTLNTKLKRQTDELGIVLNELKKAINSGNVKNETDAVKNADKKRDTRIIAFRLLVESASYSENPTIAELANLILNALNETSKKISQLSLKEETAAIHTLNELFTTNTRYADALTGLKISENWRSVWDAQQDFEGLYAYRSGIRVEEKPDAAAYEVAKKAKKLCSSTFELVEDLYNIEEKPEYLSIMEAINVEIEKTMAVVRTRQTNAAKAKYEEKSK